jgi:3-hydroxybutyryl-CoA dehydratase
MKIENGYKFSYPFTLSQEQVLIFAGLTGDTNPLHSDENYAKTTIYGQRIIPGFLGGSVFSKVFGTIFPGEGTIYLKQDMKFLKPMFPGINYQAIFEIISNDPIKKRINVKTSIADTEDNIYITGEAILQNSNEHLWL